MLKTGLFLYSCYTTKETEIFKRQLLKKRLRYKSATQAKLNSNYMVGYIMPANYFPFFFLTKLHFAAHGIIIDNQ